MKYNLNREYFILDENNKHCPNINNKEIKLKKTWTCEKAYLLNRRQILTK